jgi:hypothetical protein
MEDALSTVPEIIDVTKDRATGPELLETVEKSFSGLIDESKDPDENSK